MVAADRAVLDARQFAGIDRLVDRDHDGARLARAEPNQDRCARRERLVVQPEKPGAEPARIGWAMYNTRDHIAALDEQFAVERDADRASGALPADQRRDRPAHDRLD